MNEREIEITTDDGTMSVFTVHPKIGENFPAVILYMDASGIRDELLDMCRRIAEQGYFVLLPDLYYRLG
jgi:carboxymethylenebutenolidase